mgnify:CR=1 FL=1
MFKDNKNSLARRNLTILILAQATVGNQMVMIFIIGGLAGQSLVTNPCFATLPISLIVLGSMLSANPLSLIMQKYGRRAGFLLGTLGGTLGGIIGSIGLYPSYKVIDEDWHTFKLGLTYEDDGLTIANQLIYEMYDGHYRNVDFVPADVDDTIDYDTGHVATEDYEFDHITYTLLLEKWLSDKTVLSAGYMFNWLDGDLEWMIDQVDFDMARHPHADYTDGPLDVDEYSHIFDLSLMSAPNNTVTYLVGLNAEFGKKRTDGDVFFVGHDSLPGYVESDVLYTNQHQPIAYQYLLIFLHLYL